MAIADKKGISVASPFKLLAEQMLDVRETVDTLEERDELVTAHACPVGIMVYVKSEDTTYRYGNDKQWKAIGAEIETATDDEIEGLFI